MATTYTLMVLYLFSNVKIRFHYCETGYKAVNLVLSPYILFTTVNKMYGKNQDSQVKKIKIYQTT